MRKDLRDVFEEIRETGSSSTYKMSDDVSAQNSSSNMIYTKTRDEQISSKPNRSR